MKEYLSNTLSPKDFIAFKNLIRYFNRPAMAQSRILYFDGSYVVFYYQRHEDDMYVIEKVHVYNFE